MSLIISKQLLHTFSNDFAICTVTNFYADLRIVIWKILLEPDFKEVLQGGEYQNFSWNKKFFIHFFFLVRIQFELNKNFTFDFQQNSCPA